MLEVRRLHLLVELSHRGTIAAVASTLHMSPSGISHQLNLLEREAGTRLLERVGRGVRLTDAGRRLASRGAEILVALESAQTELRAAQQQPTGTCRVAAFGSAARIMVPVLLSTQEAHPGLRVEVVECEPEVAVPALLSGDFDLIVSEEYPGAIPPPVHQVDRRVLLEDPLELVVAPRVLAGRTPTELGIELGTEVAWALEPVGAASRSWAVQHCVALGFTPDVQYESWDLGLLLLLVRRGAAASLLPRLALPPHRESGDLARTRTGWARTLVTLVRRGREADPTVRAVREALHAAFAEPGDRSTSSFGSATDE